MARYKLDDKLEVSWTDTVRIYEWLTPADARKVSLETYCCSMGYFLRETKEFLWISPSIGTGTKDDRDVIMIPKGCIQRIKKLR